MKKTKLGLLLIVLLILISACSNSTNPKHKETKKLTAKDAQLQLIKDFVSIAYFDKGTYSDFTKLYKNPEKANTEQEFNQFRQANEPKDAVPDDYKKVSDVMKHIKIEKVDENNATAYWVENVDEGKREDAKLVWSLTKVNGKWLLYN